MILRALRWAMDDDPALACRALASVAVIANEFRDDVEIRDWLVAQRPRSQDWAHAIASLSVLAPLFDPEQRDGLLAEAATLAAAAGDQHVLRVLEAAAIYEAGFPSDLDRVRAFLAEADQAGDGFAVLMVSTAAAIVSAWLGNHREASDLCRLTRRVCVDGRLDYADSMAAVAEIVVARQRGELEAAVQLRRPGRFVQIGIRAECAQQLARLATDRADVALMETALTALGGSLGPIEMEAKRLITWSHECLRENWAGAAETISEVLESPVESPLGPIVVCVLTLDLAATLIADGRWSEGASALDRAEAQADGFREPAPLVRARVMLFRARVFLSSGSVAQADHAAYDSLGLAVDCEFGLARIDALEVIATISRQRGNDRLAARLLGACAAEREAIGYANRMSSGVDTTVPDAHRSSFEQGRALGIVEATALARRSRGARRRPAFGFESLTPTERTVAELVVLGRTNDEIAAELLIASTTVKTHLTRIFAKLGLQNRTQLAVRMTATARVASQLRPHS